MPHNGDTVVAQLEALRGRAGVPATYVAFRAALYRAQAATAGALLTRDAPPPGGDPLSADAVPLDQALLKGLLTAVRDALGTPSGDGAAMHAIFAAAASSGPLLEEIVRAACAHPRDTRLEALARARGLDTESCLFLGRALAAPFVAEAARRRGELPAPAAAIGGPSHCPRCEAAPALAILRGEEGRRVLSCSLCGHAWASARAACPFCGDGGSLGVLADREDARRWVETCDSCRNYIKTVDERRMDGRTIIPLVESITGLYLDLIAEKHGYKRGLPYAAAG